MTRAQFLAALERLALRQGRFAELTGLHPATVYHWRDGQIPLMAEMLLAAWIDNKRLTADASNPLPGISSEPHGARLYALRNGMDWPINPRM